MIISCEKTSLSQMQKLFQKKYSFLEDCFDIIRCRPEFERRRHLDEGFSCLRFMLFGKHILIKSKPKVISLNMINLQTRELLSGSGGGRACEEKGKQVSEGKMKRVASFSW